MKDTEDINNVFFFLLEINSYNVLTILSTLLIFFIFINDKIYSYTNHETVVDDH